jgi:glyoxylase-like metal-dependent hydrolase (beta-lactamase superfamily II)
VIDPGLGKQPEKILEFLADESIRLEKIILTHGHADHIAGVDPVYQAHRDAAVLISKPDHPMLSDAGKNLSGPFGLPLTVEAPVQAGLEPGQTLTLAGQAWTILDVSGHSPGGRALYYAEGHVVFTGDALFAGSIGRTDLPDADHGQLLNNIRSQLLVLPDETRVYSGHGPMTTIGNERKSNPFLSDAYE